MTAGIDVGSSAVKTVVMAHGEETPAVLSARTERIRRRDLRQVVRESFEGALAEAGCLREDLAYIATTGEGDLVDFRRGHFFGMTTHARGGLHLAPEARAVLDVGALHARAIRMDERSRVLGYRMTSQCASGSGQFLENIARYLGVALEEIGPLSLEGRRPETVSSICAVLAETDVINMVSRGIDIRDILKGIHQSMAGRFVKLLAAAGARGVVAITGGLAADAGLLACLREEAARQGVPIELTAPERSVYAGALGAALWGAYRERRLAARAPAGDLRDGTSG
ncbi:MAG: benzoyl-CoA reductase subunit D [Acidobacteria bacterium]|nr:benzoyl-CoA reductase subunit D [Acidobacteriota bacterium]